METLSFLQVIFKRSLTLLEDLLLGNFSCSENSLVSNCEKSLDSFLRSELNDMIQPYRPFMERMMEMDALTYIMHCITPVVTASLLAISFIRNYSLLCSCLRQIKTHLEDWFFFLFTLTWLLFVSQPYAILVLWRWSVNLYMRLRHGELGGVTTGADSTGSLDTPQSRQIIKSLKVLRGRCDITELRRRVQATACKLDPSTGKLAHPKFHQYLQIVGGFYCWRPSKPLDMSHHVRFADGLDACSDSIGEGKLLEIISNYSNTAFEEGRSLWEILVIPRIHYTHEEGMPGEEREEKFAILVRISHGIGDGFSFLKLVMRDLAGVDVPDYVPPHKVGGVSSWPRRICVFLYFLFKAPRSFYKELSFMDDNPLHGPGLEMSGTKFHAWSKPVDVGWLKELKTRLGTGMNTVLLNTLSTACRRYMMTIRGMHECDLPQNIHAIIPVPAPNHPNNKLVNKFSIVMLPLELSKSDSLRRCREIERENRIMSNSPDCYLNLFLMDLLSAFHISFSRYLIVNKQCTTVISNLPGPTKSVNIWGYPMVDTMFWLPNVGSSGVSVSYLSYGEKMRFGICVDSAIVPKRKDAQLLLDWMIEDLKDLASSVSLPCDEETMFINLESTSPKLPMTLSPLKVDVKSGDKDDIGSEDFGYGGEPSDISSQDSQGDTDEDSKSSSDLEELTIKVREEIVGFKNKGCISEKVKQGAGVSEKDSCDDRDLSGDADQNFLVMQDLAGDIKSKTKSMMDSGSKRRSRGPRKTSNGLLTTASIC